jgi:FemAB-related protein (PEP-CTERM system-associated)
MVTVKIETLADHDHVVEKQWDAYVAAHARGTGYHSVAWKQVMERVYRYRGHYLYATDDTGIVGALPLVHVKNMISGSQLISLPFTTYGGVLADTADIATSLTTAAQSLGERLNAAHVELRHVEDNSLALPARTHKVTMWLDLPASVDALWKSLRTEMRTDIRRREKEGLEARTAGHEELDNFYRIYCINMRDLGTPTYPRAFFATILDAWPGSAFITTIYAKGEAIASAFLLGFRETLEMPWASSLREHRKLRPNVLLYWDCLKRGVTDGFRRFDFGRSTPDEGTFVFKKQWGAVPVPLYWYHAVTRPGAALPDLNPSNPKFAHAIRVWQKLPVWVTKVVGPQLSRCFP